MARPANPHKEKIAAIKTELKDLNRDVRKGETASKKIDKLNERLAKYTGDDAAPAKSAKVAKTAKADKTAKTGSKKKVDAKAEKKSGKVVVAKKSRGRPKKVAADDEDD